MVKSTRFSTRMIMVKTSRVSTRWIRSSSASFILIIKRQKTLFVRSHIVFKKAKMQNTCIVNIQSKAKVGKKKLIDIVGLQWQARYLVISTPCTFSKPVHI